MPSFVKGCEEMLKVRTSNESRCRVSTVTVWLCLFLTGFSQEPATKPAETGGLSDFGKMVPAGFVNRGVRIPSFSDGKLRSLVLADSVTRLDDQRLFAEKVLLTLYGKARNEDVEVNLVTAHHHITDQILRSTHRSRVRRADFEVVGDAMVFDAATSVGRMTGRVHTMIFDTGALSGKSTPAAKSQK